MSVHDDLSVSSQDVLKKSNNADDAAKCKDISSSQLIRQLMKQLQRHHNCNVQQNNHNTSEDFTSSDVSLLNMTVWNCLDMLRKVSIFKYSMSWDFLLLIKKHQWLYYEVTSRSETSRSSNDKKSDSRHTTIDLKSDMMLITSSLHAKFNIDSAEEFAFSLTVTCDKFNWKMLQSSINNLKSSLHLNQLSIQWVNERTDRLHCSQQSVHQISHLLFERLIKFIKMKIYLLFSNLFNEKHQKWVIIKKKYELWIDQIFFL